MLFLILSRYFWQLEIHLATDAGKGDGGHEASNVDVFYIRQNIYGNYTDEKLSIS